MKLIETKIKDLYIIEPEIFGDNRGWFTESWSKKKFEDNGLFYDFVQDNHSLSTKKNTLRGIHFQYGKYAQAKLVRCCKGKVLDVAIDLRFNSPTYKNWIAVELTAENKKQFLIPRGFGHAFLTLTNDVEFLYKADNFYDKASEDSIIWNDPILNIDWSVKNPIVSEKDSLAKNFDEQKIYFD